ncbi:MAG: SAM-dependent methyltransferase [Microbacteriaceae bacterium]
MNEQEIETLLQQESLTLLEELNQRLPQPLQDGALISIITELRKAGVPAETVNIVLSQLKLQRRAIAKFGEFSPKMLFSEAGLEQATRLPVARHHAKRFLGADIKELLDLGSGIGGDALAFSLAGLTVLAVERDAVTARLATHNLAPYPNAQVLCADADSAVTDRFRQHPNEALWFDPARREVGARGQRKLHDPSDWSPSLDWVFEQGRTRSIGVKLSPALDTTLIPPDVEAQWVSDNGSVVELVLWSGKLRRDGIGRSALILRDNATHELNAAGESPDEDVAELQEYLYEPDGAVIRAHLIGDLSRTLNAHPIDPTIAYISGSEYFETPFAQAFRVLEVLPAKVEKLRRAMTERNIGSLEIKKRGADLDPAVLRKQLKLSGKETATLIITRIAGKHCAILAERVA